MKKLLLGLLITGLSTLSYANSELQTFTTLQQAEANCALPNTMSFTPANPSNPDSKGVITGKSQDGSTFESWNDNTHSHYFMKPYTNPISSHFNLINGSYGYKSGELTTCFYQYTGFTGINVYLVMRSV